MPLLGDGQAKGFAYQWNPTKLSTARAAFNRTIIENFRQLETFINGYVVTKSPDGATVPIEDLTVSASVTFTGAPVYADGPESAMVYRDATQAIGATAWTKVQFNAANGSSGTILTEDTSTEYGIVVSEPGVYLVRAQAIFSADENAYVRVLDDGVERVRGSSYSRNSVGVCGVVVVTALSGTTFTAEVYTDTASTVQAGTNNSFLTVTRLHGV